MRGREGPKRSHIGQGITTFVYRVSEIHAGPPNWLAYLNRFEENDLTVVVENNSINKDLCDASSPKTHTQYGRGRNRAHKERTSLPEDMQIVASSREAGAQTSPRTQSEAKEMLNVCAIAMETWRLARRACSRPRVSCSAPAPSHGLQAHRAYNQ